MAGFPPGCVGYWKLDENSGTAAADATGRGHGGTLQAPLGTWAAGKLGASSFSGDGSKGPVAIPDHAELNAGSAFTCSAWIYPNSIAGDIGIVCKWDYQTQGSWAMQTASGGTGGLQAFVPPTAADNGSGSYVKTAGGFITVSAWNHVAFVYDGSLTNVDRIKLFVNGVQVAAPVVGTVPTVGAAGTATMKIGSFGGSLPRLWNGRIDEVGVWGRALTASEISDLYNGGAGLAYPSGPVLAVEARDLAPGTVTDWDDRSVNDNDVVPGGGSVSYTAGAGFVTLLGKTNFVKTEANIPITGAAPRHLFALLRTRNVAGTMLGFGTGGNGSIFDLWNYNPGSLIWHGLGAGFDSVAGAPALTPNVWHVCEASYDGTTVTVRVDNGTAATKAAALVTGAAPLLLGMGGWAGSSGGSDFDLAAVYLYDRVLTGTERTDLIAYLNGLIGPPPQTVPVQGVLPVILDLHIVGEAKAGEQVVGYSAASTQFGTPTIKTAVTVPVAGLDPGAGVAGPDEWMLNPAITPPAPSAGNYTTGNKFVPSADGQITSIRYWNAGTGTYVVSIWDYVTQARLATASDIVASGPGWREVVLPTPLSVVSGKTYAVTRYIGTNYSMASPIPTSLAPHLTLGVGVYQGGDGFPVSSNSQNYFCDVVYHTGGTASPRFGTPTIRQVTYAAPPGVPSAQQFGAVKANQIVHPAGVQSAQAFGIGHLKYNQTVAVPGLSPGITPHICGMYLCGQALVGWASVTGQSQFGKPKVGIWGVHPGVPVDIIIYPTTPVTIVLPPSEVEEPDEWIIRPTIPVPM